MKNKKKVKIKNLLVILVIVLIVGGGLTWGLIKVFSKKAPALETNNQEEIKEEQKDEPKVKIVDVNSKSRPYAVMINNLAAARPYHTGLQDAYLVYEIVVEGGITRYLALFKDNLPEVVGSVRSSRHYYLDYALENDAYYVHWGWSPQAQSDISSLKINNINGLTYSNPYFFRKNIQGVNSEHTGFANIKEMPALTEKLGYRQETNKDLLLDYSATSIDLDTIENKQEANNLDFTYSKSFVTNYIYDAENKVYKQYVNDKEHTDYETKEQYTVKNIITYKVKNTSIDSYGRQDLKNIGKGEGYFITEGYAMPITWEKKDRSSQTVYRYKDTGEEIVVNDGNTWIHIVPESGDISIS